MTAETREMEVLEAFMRLAESMVDDYDVIDVLQTLVERCVRLFDAAAAGITLVTADGGLQVVASSSERSHLVGLMQLRTDQGPCLEAATTGRMVSAGDPSEIDDRWPAFADAARPAGYESIHAVPLRLKESTIGSLNLFRTRPGELAAADKTAGQALAAVATIGVLHERRHHEDSAVRAQLQHALDSRVVIEQAKGILAQAHDVDVDQAFALLRDYARSHRRHLADVAAEITARTLTL